MNKRETLKEIRYHASSLVTLLTKIGDAKGAAAATKIWDSTKKKMGAA